MLEFIFSLYLIWSMSLKTLIVAAPWNVWWDNLIETVDATPALPVNVAMLDLAFRCSLSGKKRSECVFITQNLLFRSFLEFVWYRLSGCVDRLATTNFQSQHTRNSLLLSPFFLPGSCLTRTVSERKQMLLIYQIYLTC